MNLTNNLQKGVQMFSDEEIRTAMGGLVEQKGENHTAPARYADLTTGAGACFLGALCEYMGVAIPMAGTPANLVLSAYGASAKMRNAFVVAQCLNDSDFEWKYVLLGVDMVLAETRDVKQSLGCPCGCTGDGALRQIMDEVRAIRSLDKSAMHAEAMAVMTANANAASKALGALGQIKFGGSMATTTLGSKITMNIGSGSLSGGYIYSGTAALAASKKDHALVA